MVGVVGGGGGGKRAMGRNKGYGWLEGTFWYSQKSRTWGLEQQTVGWEDEAGRAVRSTTAPALVRWWSTSSCGSAGTLPSPVIIIITHKTEKPFHQQGGVYPFCYTGKYSLNMCQLGWKADRQRMDGFCSMYSAIWLLHGWYHLKLLQHQCMFCVHHTTMHQFTVSLYSKPHA